MPLYEYQCAECGRFELIRKFSDAPLSSCPTCGKDVQKLPSAPAIQFKGSGWYVTDYARKSSGGDGASSQAASTGASDTGGASKNGAAAEAKSTGGNSSGASSSGEKSSASSSSGGKPSGESASSGKSSGGSSSR